MVRISGVCSKLQLVPPWREAVVVAHQGFRGIWEHPCQGEEAGWRGDNGVLTCARYKLCICHR